MSKIHSILEALQGKRRYTSFPAKCVEDHINNASEKIRTTLCRLEWEWKSSFEKDKFTCPLNGGWSKIAPAGQDFWRRSGKDRTCSYCGSWHPEEFLAHVEKVIAHGGIDYRASLNDHKDKIYVDRPNVFNAGDGAIKFKTAHLWQYLRENNMNETPVIERVNKAMKLSNDEFMKQFRKTTEESDVSTPKS